MKKLFISLMVLFAFVTHNQAKEWNFSDPHWFAGAQIMNPIIIDGLLVLADTTMDVAVNNNFIPKAYLSPDNVAGTFTQRLQLKGAASFLPELPSVPTARAVAFPVVGPGTISVYCLSSSITEAQQLIISNGQQVLATVTAENSNYKGSDGTEVPLFQYEYTGEESAIVLYSTSGGIDLYAIAATNYGDSIVPPDNLVPFYVEVPTGTNECWITGNFNGWNPAANKMVRVDDTHFSTALPIAYMSNIEYKYLSGPGWAYVEKDADGQEIANRIYAGGTDVVVNWLSVFNPSTAINKNVTFRVTVPSQVEILRVVGSHNNWYPGDSAVVMDHIGTTPQGKLFSKTIFINDAEHLEYKFVAGSDWAYVQSHDPNYVNADPTQDTIRHNVYGFYSYESTNAMPLTWNFTKDPFGVDSTFTDNTDMWSLQILASPDRAVVVDANVKTYDQIQFNYRLKLGGSAVMDANYPNLPVSRALAFNVAGNAQIAVSCLSSSSTVDRQLVISNGINELGSIAAPGVYSDGGSNVPLTVFSYEGPATVLYLYSKDSGINIYYVAVSNFSPPSMTYTVDVPVETHEVWIAGDFNNWISGAQKMERVDENTFTALVLGATFDHGYKYLSGKDWQYVEVHADSTEISNRSYQPVDTVVKWMNLFIPNDTINYSMTYTVQVPIVTQQVFIAGDFNNWQPHWMERVDSVTFTTTYWGATPQHQYKYLNGPDWKYVEVHSDASAVANRNYNQLDVVEAWAKLNIQEEVKIYYEDINTVVGEDIWITLKSTSNLPRNVISYQFTLSYDSDVLEYIGHSVDGTISEAGNIVVNSTTDNEYIYISYMNSESFTNVGDLLHLQFKVINDYDYNWTNCWVQDFYYDNVQVWNFEPGEIWINSFTTGDVDGNDMIQAYDAALTLQYSVGKDPLPQLDPLPWETWRLKAADVDGVEGVTANDAAMILQYSARVIYTFPVDDTPEAGMAIKANNTADVTISEEDEMLVFRSSGNLIGLNVYLQNNLEVLGAPQFASNVDLSAVNMEDGQYAIGLVALEAPAEGAEIMRIPILKGSDSDLIFHLIVNADEKIVNSRITTGMNNVSTTAVNLRPNPVLDMLYISNLTVGSRLVVYDISGRALIMQEVQSDREQLDVSNLNGGVYTIVISNNEKQLISKFIKK